MRPASGERATIAPATPHPNAAVIFDSEYGNTEKVARALAKGLHEEGLTVDCLNIRDVAPPILNDYDLLAFGAPTQALTVSKRMKDFLTRLAGMDFQHKYGFAFDTKLKSMFAGSGGGFVEKKMRSLGFEIIEPHFSAIVKGKAGPLEEGSEKNFEKMGAYIGSRWR